MSVESIEDLSNSNLSSAKSRYENWRDKGGVNKAAVSDEDDSEIESDDAFDSDDEEMYGDMFAKSKRGEDSDSDSGDGDAPEAEAASESDGDSDGDSSSSSSSSEDETENDGGAYMLSLLDNLGGDSTAASSPSTTTTTTTNNINNSNNELSLDDLLNPITSHSTYTNTNKNLQSLNTTSTTSAPLPSVVTGRISRGLHYGESKKDAGGWTRAVKDNREAETLDFRGDMGANRKVVTLESLGEKFEADDIDGGLEKQVMEALEKQREGEEQMDLGGVANQISEDLDKDKYDSNSDSDSGDDLGESRMTEEELRNKHGELARIRGLMFYEERKRHQINKIKSKRYRKIRKKKGEKDKEREMEMLREEDPELARELDEKEEIKRMKERMTLQHKNTSKWARQQLKRGKSMDKDTRKALSAQITQGDELRKKMMGDDDDDENNDDDSDNDMSSDPTELYMRAKNIAREASNPTADDEEIAKSKSGLFKMQFMQNGIKSQRERAKNEAQKLMAELREEMGDGMDDGGDGDGDGGEDDFLYDSAKVGGGKDDEDKNKDENHEEEEAGGKHFTMSVRQNNNEATATATATAAAKKAKKNPKPSSNSTLAIDNNPWVKNKKGGKNKSHIDAVDINKGVELLINSNSNSNSNDTVTNTKISANNNISTLTQNELVHKAFAADSSFTEEEFRKEKEMLTERDDPNSKLNKAEDDKKVSGWGSWSGAGVKAPKVNNNNNKKKQKKLPKNMTAPDKKVVAKRKRADDGLSTVIINEKRLKKTSTYKVNDIPYPFTSAEQYEKAMGGALGPEWNTSDALKDLTRPEIVTRIGKVIDPLNKRMKSKSHKRTPAKF